MQNNKSLIITIGILVVLVAAAVALYMTRTAAEEIPNDNNTDVVGNASGDDLNSVVVNDQVPGDVVFYNNLILSEDGFVVVRKDELGVPGEIIGVKTVEAGDNAPGNIDLIEPTVEGGKYFIELYKDVDENGVFNEEVDTLIRTSTNRAIRVEITTTEDLPEMKG